MKEKRGEIIDAFFHAHYDALEVYKNDVRRRMAHIIVTKGGPHTLANQVARDISTGLEDLLVGGTHEEVRSYLEKML